MKKRSILNLIRYHVENNDPGFRTEAYEIAKEFDQGGDTQLAAYIMAQLSNVNTFVPQMTESDSPFLKKVAPPSEPLFLPWLKKKKTNNCKLYSSNSINHR